MSSDLHEVMSLGYGFFLLLFVLVILYIARHIKTVHQQSRYVVECFGVPLAKPWHPGLNILWPFCSIRERVDLRQQQISLQSQVKTSDDVFVTISYVIRFAVSPDDQSVMDFVYKVAEPVKQLEWRVENEIRQIITGMDFDKLYSQKDAISIKVVSDQNEKALETGIKILEVVIEQPVPPQDIQEAMNNKIAQFNKKIAAAYEADAERIRLVGIAQAQAESKRLQGVGIANQRNEIANGIEGAMSKLRAGGMTSEQAQAILFKTIEADMVTTASIEKSNTFVFVPTDMGQYKSEQIMGSLSLIAARSARTQQETPQT